MTAADAALDIALAQRGRALIDFEVGVRQAASRLAAKAEAVLATRGVRADTLPEAMDDRHALIDRTLDDVAAHRTRWLLNDWSWREHGRVAEEAFDEVRAEAAPKLDALSQGGTTLTQAEDFVAPRYWSEVWFHRTKGGWDASDYNGYVHGELVHKRYVAKIFPGDIYRARREVLDLLPARDFARILELGTSSGHFTAALDERFPEAEIVGVDLSRRMLEQAQRVGNARGRSWQLHVAAGEATGFADASFDLVTSYAIHHELPPRIIKAWFEEAFRLLKPGGSLLMADVPRYADLDRMAAWRFDWAAKWGGEPFWRSSAMLDLGEGARAAGFAEVKTQAGNPYVVLGRKPDA